MLILGLVVAGSQSASCGRGFFRAHGERRNLAIWCRRWSAKLPIRVGRLGRTISSWMNRRGRILSRDQSDGLFFGVGPRLRKKTIKTYWERCTRTRYLQIGDDFGNGMRVGKELAREAAGRV